ncbi:MAG: acyl-CoA dehydratase activase-related protein, partial [Oscillospiraceae bacterium]|nr:acyl-CoA dehydratase activase-related protein [Oscillospiraceae bacterium]
MRIGVDVGSTTIKCVALNEGNEIVFSCYERHYSQITQKITEILLKIKKALPGTANVTMAFSGSAGMGIAEKCKIDFVQEVYATRVAAGAFIPDTDVIIELGGEDAKILYLTGGVEVRMNGTCAGGTGAFIDQMATLLDTPLEEMNALAAGYEKTYSIASRCGVFAKSDIQPLLNQGARKSDIAESIFCAVVNQTVAGLAQGRAIAGKVVYLGGPLTFMEQLRKRFDKVLDVQGICPPNSLYYVAMGAALCAENKVNLDKAIQKVMLYKGHFGNFATHKPLFASQNDYDEFVQRHAKADVALGKLSGYSGKTYIGMDAGSTTVKAVVIGQNGELLHEKYMPSKGNPVELIKAFLEEVYAINPDIYIASTAVTGYGEEIVKNAFMVDFGLVETIAHFTAAKNFSPDVEFIIDIGGQDIKCFKIRKGAISNIFLNEACSSGCGSFLQTFANALSYSIKDFARLGLFAKHPVDLGSRCTVFMNSSVKQAQKDGATIEDISAGLSLSVVKNALYKVIRAGSPDELGKKIVVQGGTFLNDAVLRAFEQELQTEVVRPRIAGLMGAYGAALYARQKAPKNAKSTILSSAGLTEFEHKITVANCGLCANNCRLTVNSFKGGGKFIGGNRCERPITNKTPQTELDIYRFKLDLLKGYGVGEYAPPQKHDYNNEAKPTIGLPMGLNIYEMLPFWHRFFSSLGFNVVTSPFSSKKLYARGQQTIPSDTVCFPAKLMHGHIQYLIDSGVQNIFYPCLSYNIDEGLGDNHYNCPVVAYYPEVIKNNMADVDKITFINDYLGVHRKKDFPSKIFAVLKEYFPNIKQKDVKAAAKNAYAEYDLYMEKIRKKGDEIIAAARQQGKHIFVLSGRPYHADPEINHGIDKLINSFNVALISEDVVSGRMPKQKTNVLNQWTYHSRLYSAAEYISTQPDMDLIQLV